MKKLFTLTIVIALILAFTIPASAVIKNIRFERPIKKKTMDRFMRTPWGTDMKTFKKNFHKRDMMKKTDYSEPQLMGFAINTVVVNNMINVNNIFFDFYSDSPIKKSRKNYKHFKLRAVRLTASGYDNTYDEYVNIYGEPDYYYETVDNKDNEKRYALWVREDLGRMITVTGGYATTAFHQPFKQETVDEFLSHTGVPSTPPQIVESSHEMSKFMGISWNLNANRFRKEFKYAGQAKLSGKGVAKMDKLIPAHLRNFPLLTGLKVDISFNFETTGNKLMTRQRNWHKFYLKTVVMDFDSLDFDTLAKIFKKKYGEPQKVENATVQDKAGNSVEQTILYWSNEELQRNISLHRYNKKMEQGSALFSPFNYKEAKEERLDDAGAKF